MVTTSEPSPAAKSSSSSADPFSSLHRMSTTAGVGLHDYVAVNNVAVVAAIAGLLSGFALAADALLVLPAFAAVCSISALVQVSKSNGTQTGKLLAVFGLLLAIGFASTVVLRLNKESKAFAESQREIGSVFTAVEGSFKAGDYQKAYSEFGPAFQSKAKYKDFEGFLKMLEGHPEYGKINAISWNGKLEKLQASDEAGTDIARAVVATKFEHSARDLPSDVMLVRRSAASGGDGRWVIESMALFESLTKAAPPANGAPQGGGAGGGK